MTVRHGLASFALVLCVAAGAAAQTHGGIRASISGDPNQFYFGGHIETNPIVEHLTFRPNVEVGLGNNFTSVDMNFEFAYWIPLRRRIWSAYFGGGPAAIIVSSGAHKPGEDSSRVGGGFNVLLGVQHRRGLFTELKVGVVDSPSVKFTVGYAMR